MGFTPFPLHRQRRIFGTAGNAIFIERAAGFRNGDSSVKRDICFLNGSILKQVFLNFDRIESCIPKKNFRANSLLTMGICFQNHNVIGLVFPAVFVSGNGHHYLIEPENVTSPEIQMLISQMNIPVLNGRQSGQRVPQ